MDRTTPLPDGARTTPSPVARHAGGTGLMRQVLLAVLSGLMIPLCFPPCGWRPLALVAWLPLVYVATRTTARRAFYLGLLQGLLAFGTTLHWMTAIFGPGAFPLYGILAVFTALFCLLYNILGRRLGNPGATSVLAAVLWTAIEFYRCELFVLRFPWITPGTALGPNGLLPLVGVYGVSCLVLLFTAALADRRTMPLASVTGVLLGTLVLVRPGPVDAPDGADAVRVVLVQTEASPILRHVALTETAAGTRPDLVVWPEYAAAYDIRRRPGEFASVVGLCDRLGATLVFGTKTVVGPGRMDWHNTALTVDGGGARGEHHKTRPVHFLNDGIAGTTCAPVRTALGRLGTPVCFDADGTAVIREMVRRGAEMIAVPVLDDRSWGAVQHLQHAELIRLRAAENGRWVVSAASSGVSQIVDPHGHVHASLPPMAEGVLTGRAGRARGLTFFTRAGWIFPWAAVVLAAGMAGMALGRGRARAGEGPPTRGVQQTARPR